ncbi:MAG: TetR/AcrR family transcriptional regulator, partial [Stackebrandtia sp.]
MVYLYFGSKEELFVACIRREAGRLMEMISDVVEPGESPRDQLWHALRAFFGFVSAHRGAWSVLYLQARNQGGPFAVEAQQMRRDTVVLTSQLLARAEDVPGPPDEQVGAAAHALVGACESLADWMIDHPDADPEVTAHRVLRFVWPGLSAMMEPASSGSEPG